MWKGVFIMQKYKVVDIADQKGGVSKTTTTEHPGIGLVKAGKRVILIDFDPQANLTSCQGWKKIIELYDMKNTRKTCVYTITGDITMWN